MLNSRMQLHHAAADSHSRAQASRRPVALTGGGNAPMATPVSKDAAHVLPMGVLEASRRADAIDGRSAPRLPNEAHDVLRRRFARARVRVSTSTTASTTESTTPHTAIKRGDVSVVSANLVGYRRLITELFGNAGVLPPSHLNVKDASRSIGARARTLHLVNGGGR